MDTEIYLLIIKTLDGLFHSGMRMPSMTKQLF